MDDLNTEHEQKALPRHEEPLLLPPPRRRPSVLRRIIWIVILLLIVAAVAWWIHARPAATPKRGGRFSNTGTMPVVAATVKTGDIDITDTALGTVTALATVTVQSQISGQLTQVAFKEGQDVRKGDFLAQIDPRPYQAALDQAQGTLLHDQGLLGEAQTDLKRYQLLARQNSIARQQADDQAYLVRQYTGTVQADEAAVETARLNLVYCHIVSPVTGRVGLRLIDPGNYVAAVAVQASTSSSGSGIAVITQMQPISVIYTIPQGELPAVLQQMSGGAKLSVTASDATGTTQLATGTLSAVDSQIDTTTGTIKLRAQFDNPKEIMFPNEFVNVRMLVSVLKNATVIPTAAVQRGAPGTFVYLVKPGNTVSVQVIKLGPQSGDSVAVTSGLSAGQQVVIDGADKLKEGAKVTLHQEGTAATPPAAAAAPTGSGPGQKTAKTVTPRGAASTTQPQAATTPPAPAATTAPQTPAAPAAPTTPPAAGSAQPGQGAQPANGQ